MAIELRELFWQDILVITICGVLILINLGLALLFFKKSHVKRSKMQLVLGLFQLVGAYVALMYGIHQMITISPGFDAFIEDAFIIGMILLPLLLIRIASEICKSEPSLVIEIIFFATKLACFIPVLLLPTNEIVGLLVFVPMIIVLAFVIYFLIYRPHKIKKDLHIDDHVLKVALDIVGGSAILFIVVLFTFIMYSYFHYFAIILTGFILYFVFLGTVYLGYYNPLWWRKIVSHTGTCEWCYGEFDECLNIIEEEERQERMMKDIKLEDFDNLEGVEEVDEMEDLKDLIDGFENLKKMGDLKDPDSSE